MVIAVGGCDNVEWGGIDIGVVPPPPRADDTAGVEPASPVAEGPVLFYVHRDTAGPTVIPVAHVTGDGLEPIEPGDDIEAFGAYFIETFLSSGTDLALFQQGRRVGTLTVDTAALPVDAVCRPVPRATGSLDLTGEADAGTEFLAMSAAAAPGSRDGPTFQPARSMEVVSDMLAGEMLREREVTAPNIAAARAQLQPFPLATGPDPGFTATYLVDDSLGLGGDDTGAALFVVFTPRDQDGYEPAFVGFTDYSSGKAAPRVIDFLDWDDNGTVEILLEVFGTRASWFRAVGRQDGRWRGLFEDRCDPRSAPASLDTADIGTGSAQPPGETPQSTTRRQPTTTRQPAAATDRPTAGFESIPDIQPTIQLSNPSQTPRVGRTTATDSAIRDTVPPDTGGVADGAAGGT